MMNTLHIRSPGAQQPGFVASKTPRLIDQELQVKNVSSTLPPWPQGPLSTHSNALALWFSPPHSIGERQP